MAFFNHPEKEYLCEPGIVQNYLSKISGPLLDRKGLHVEVTPVNFVELSSSREAEKSIKIRERLMQARTIQDKGFEDNDALHINTQMSPNMVRQIYVID